MRVSVFGLGYVGTVTAACLARSGHLVVGVDSDPDKVRITKAGGSPLSEPGLAELVRDGVQAGLLDATQTVADAVARTDLALISVGTPSQADGDIDLTAITRVGEELGQALAEGPDRPYLVVLRSTALPGTVENVLRPALQRGAGRALRQLRFAVNPEFMREGSSIQDFTYPAFTLVGSDDAAAIATLSSLYSRVEAPFIATSVANAEMVKYACNAYHAVKVSFSNELADLCDAFGASGEEVMRIFLLDRRLNVSAAYLRPGFAFGGSCLGKDLRALVSGGRRTKTAAPLLAATLLSNAGQVSRAVRAILAIGRARVGLVGLAFKPGTDDLRDSPLVTLLRELRVVGTDVRVYDPGINLASLTGANRRGIEERIPDLAALLCPTAQALLAHAEVVVVGHASRDAARILESVRTDQVVVDLTRGQVQRHRLAVELHRAGTA